jgi:hypothetical protein
MSSPLRVHEYVKAAKRARHCAESERNSQAKQILQEIERSYHRLVEIEKWVRLPTFLHPPIRKLTREPRLRSDFQFSKRVKVPPVSSDSL